MREAEEIRRGLRNMLEKESSVFQATVTAVNEEEATCTVLEDGVVSYYDVRLRSVINPELNGLTTIPKIGSHVLVSRIGGSNELFVCLFSEIDKVLFCNEEINFILDNEMMSADVKGTVVDVTEAGISIQNSDNKINCKLENSGMELNVDGNTIEIGGSTITFNGGKNDGLVKVSELTNKINDFISIYNNHTHTVEAKGISVVSTVGKLDNDLSVKVPSTNNSCKTFTQNNYENSNIKH